MVWRLERDWTSFSVEELSQEGMGTYPGGSMMAFSPGRYKASITTSVMLSKYYQQVKTINSLKTIVICNCI